MAAGGRDGGRRPRWRQAAAMAAGGHDGGREPSVGHSSASTGLVAQLALAPPLEGESHHVTRGRRRLDQPHGLLAAQVCDELVEDEQRGRTEGVLPKVLRVQPEQRQDQPVQLVDAHKEAVAARVLAEALPQLVGKLGAAHALARRDKHQEH